MQVQVGMDIDAGGMQAATPSFLCAKIMMLSLHLGRGSRWIIDRKVAF